jgi:hypothetical protein
MKKAIVTSIVMLSALAATAAITVTNLITYGASGGARTNYGVPVFIGNAYVALPPTINVSHAALATTTSVVTYIGIGTSTDSNLMSNISTNYPATTNANEEIITLSSFTIPIYLQTTVVTTNNSTVGTKAIFNSN